MRTTVALARCPSYEFPAVAGAVNTVMTILGGTARFVREGSSVLIKPNLLSDRTPDCAVTTHPEIVRALLRIVKKHGATPVVADSSASALKTTDVWEKTGYRELCEEESVSLINLENAGSTGFDVNGMRFSVAKPVLDADLVINVPKLKTHLLTVLTNAVKNLYGTLPGYQKTMLHKRYSHPKPFGEFLGTLYDKVRPALTICDAVIGMDGDGPSSGNPVHLGFVAGSADGVALDAAMCRLLGIDMRKVFYFKALKRLGAGETDLREIDLAGDPPESLSLPVFRQPFSWPGRMIPERLLAMIRPFVWIRPSFTDLCSSCGTCVKACPMSAIEMDDGDHPRLIAGRCIECCCCHEVCFRGAIRMERSPLMRLFFSRRFPK